jgi:hypothetical protein
MARKRHCIIAIPKSLYIKFILNLIQYRKADNFAQISAAKLRVNATGKIAPLATAKFFGHSA